MKYRELPIEERARVNKFYKLTAYRRPVSANDRVFVVEDQIIYGAVRIESRDNVQILRGMYMHPEYVRRGMGSNLLDHIEPVLAQTDSYCIPFAHLVDFYGRVGFEAIEAEEAPVFLSERVQRYFGEGKDVLMMFRPTDARS